MHSSFLLAQNKGHEIEKGNFFTLYDRIINLKITVEDDKTKEKQEYIIRSDYEIVYPNAVNTMIRQSGSFNDLNKYYVRKCSIKPDIKLEYKRITSGIGTELKIDITNFYLVDSSGKKIMSFSTDGFSIVRVDVQMGYFGQFARLPHSTMQELFEFPEKLPFGITTLVLSTVPYVTVESLQPDYVLRINGFVGNTYGEATCTNLLATGLNLDGTIDTTLLNDLHEAENCAPQDFIEKYLELWITRRFVRDGSVIPIIDYSGLMPKDFASKYGVKVFCSDGVKEVSAAFCESIEQVDSNNVVSRKFAWDIAGNTVIQTLNNMNSNFNWGIQFFELDDGNFIAYTEKEFAENHRTVIEFVNGKLYALNPNYFNNANFFEHCLPAIYQANYDAGTCTVACPFFWTIMPFEEVEFKSRVMKQGLASFFSRLESSKKTFAPISLEIVFATVQDLNEMQFVAYYT